jgi:S1-C subfamily serine protease
MKFSRLLFLLAFLTESAYSTDYFGTSLYEFKTVYLEMYVKACENPSHYTALGMNDQEYWKMDIHPIQGSAAALAVTACDRCKLVDKNCNSPLLKRLISELKKSGSSSGYDEASRELFATGTGFVINKNYVMTAEHVISECSSVSVRHKHQEADAMVVARDANNDLGLLRLSKSHDETARLRDGTPVILGEEVANYGYPLFGELSDSAKVTQGHINALAGWQNDSTILQFDAPTQPGNSGGALIDSSGNVIGIVSSQLGINYVEATGQIAQNVNFGIKSYLIEAFLDANGVSYEKAESNENLNLPNIARVAEQFTVLVGCWR